MARPATHRAVSPLQATRHISAMLLLLIGNACRDGADLLAPDRSASARPVLSTTAGSGVVTLPAGFVSRTVTSGAPLRNIGGLGVSADGALLYVSDYTPYEWGSPTAVLEINANTGASRTLVASLPAIYVGRLAIGDASAPFGTDLYVSDNNAEMTQDCCNGGVFRIDRATGSFADPSGTPRFTDMGGSDEYGIAFAPSGSPFAPGLYAVDGAWGPFGRPSVIRWDGATTTTVATFSDWDARSPQEIAFDPSRVFGGDLFVSDAYGAENGLERGIFRVRPDGSYSEFAMGVSGAMAFGRGGVFGSDLYVLDGTTIRRIASDGTSSSFATDIPSAPVYRATLAFSRDGRHLYVGVADAILDIRSNQPPIAVPGGPYTGTAGASLALDGTASTDPDGDSLTYAWDFGDGSSGTGASTTHTYAGYGSYTATLTVTDPFGATNRATVSVSVSSDRRILLFHNDHFYDDTDPSQYVRDNLLATGVFAPRNVGVLAMTATPPDLSTLLGFDCVFVWTNNSPDPANPVGIGDRLREYADAGGGVVLVPGAISTDQYATMQLRGGIRDRGYTPLVPTGANTANTSTHALDFTTADRRHPILDGVNDYTYGNVGQVYADVTLDPGATLVARDLEGVPLIAVSANRHVASLNTYPAQGFAKSRGVWRAYANACLETAGHGRLNRAPVANAGQASNASEAAPITFDGSGSSDPDGDAITYDWDFGDGTAHGSGSQPVHSYADNGVYTVRLTVGDGTLTSSATTVATIANSAPRATLVPSATTVDEGQPFSLTLANPTDSSSADLAAGLRFAVDCGGGTFSATSYATASPSNTSSCGTRDGATTLNVRGRVYDKDGGMSEYADRVVVRNVPPQVSIGPLLRDSLGAALNVTFDDAAGNADAVSNGKFTVTLAWDDGATQSLGLAIGTSTIQHTYAIGGQHSVTVRVADKDGGVGTASATFDLTQPVSIAALTAKSGQIPVQITSTRVFDATKLDIARLRFGAAPVTANGKGYLCNTKVNTLGFTDLTCQFDAALIGLNTKGSTVVSLTGFDPDPAPYGRRIKGSTTVK